MSVSREILEGGLESSATQTDGLAVIHLQGQLAEWKHFWIRKSSRERDHLWWSRGQDLGHFSDERWLPGSRNVVEKSGVNHGGAPQLSSWLTISQMKHSVSPLFSVLCYVKLFSRTQNRQKGGEREREREVSQVGLAEAQLIWPRKKCCLVGTKLDCPALPPSLPVLTDRIVFSPVIVEPGDRIITTY